MQSFIYFQVTKDIHYNNEQNYYTPLFLLIHILLLFKLFCKYGNLLKILTNNLNIVMLIKLQREIFLKIILFLSLSSLRTERLK